MELIMYRTKDDEDDLSRCILIINEEYYTKISRAMIDDKEFIVNFANEYLETIKKGS